jgi:hypothetical protein
MALQGKRWLYRAKQWLYRPNDGFTSFTGGSTGFKDGFTARKMVLQPPTTALQHPEMVLQPKIWLYSRKDRSAAEKMAPQRTQIRLAQLRGLGADRHGVG